MITLSSLKLAYVLSLELLNNMSYEQIVFNKNYKLE